MKKQPKKSLERILSQEFLTGADLGKLFVMDWIGTLTGEALFTQEEVNQLFAGYLPSKHERIFKQYKAIQLTLSDIFNSYRMCYMKFMIGRRSMQCKLKDILDKERSYRQYLDQPILMTPADYSRLLKKSGKAPRGVALSLTAARYVRMMLDGTDVPGEVREEFDALKDIPLQDADRSKILCRCFSEKYCLPCDEQKIREFILDAMSFVAIVEDDADTQPTDQLIENFESAMKSACKSAGIEHDVRYLKDRPCDQRGLLVRLCGLGEIHLDQFDQFRAFLDAVKKFPVEEEGARAAYLSGLRDADFIRRKKALAGLAVCHGGAGIDTEKKLFAKFSKMNFLDGDDAKIKKEFKFWMSSAMAFVRGGEAMLDVYGDFLGVSFSKLIISDDLPIELKEYNEGIMLAYALAPGNPDASAALREGIKATYKPMREADYKTSEFKKNELVEALKDKELEDLNKGKTYSIFFDEEAGVSYGRR